MAMPTLSVPQYPSVPAAPGVPALLSTIDQVQNTVVLAVADALLVLNMFAPPQWGLFASGVQVVKPDSVISVSYRQDDRISSAPQEQGGFNSYNKVALPYDARITFAKGGTVAQKNAFINSIMAAQKSLNLYEVVTPEAVYFSANVVHHDYDRSQRSGAGLLLVDVWVEEVRIGGTSQFTNTQNSASQSSQNQGQVQAGTPTSSEVPPTSSIG